jgi:AsmA family protein
MRIGRIVGIVVVVFVAVIGAGAAYLSSLDVDEYRGEIAQAAQDLTGRALKLEGPLALSVSLTPTVSGEGISLANAPWGSRPQMLTLQRFEVQLQLLPLLFGDVQVNRLILIEPDILLETDAKGRANWIFQAPGEGKGETAAADGGGAIPNIGRLSIENGLLTYRDGVSGEITKITLTAVEAEAKSTDDPLQLTVQAAFNDMAVKLNGSLGPLKNAIGGDQPVQIDLTAQGLGLTARIKGSAKATTGALDARIDVSAADLSGLRPLAGDAVPANVGLKFSAQAKAAGSKADLSDLSLVLGNSDLAGSFSVDTSGKLPMVTADLSGKRLDLVQLLPPVDKDGASKKPTGKKTSRPGKVFPNQRLPLGVLKALDANMKLSLAEVVAPDISLRDVSVAASLKKGRLSLKPISLTVAGSAVKLAASVDAGRKVPAVVFEMAASKLDLGRLLSEAKATDLLHGTGNLSVKLAGRGQSVAAIAGSLNGDTKLLMNEGKVKTAAFDAAIGGLSAIAGMMSSETSEWTVLNCVASRFEIKKGIATSQVLLADTEYSTIVGEGSMDLGKETLAMKVSPQSKSATLNVAVPIKVGGTFAEPTFRPDELATARRLGGLLGTTAFPPLALLALGDIGSGDDNPCLKIAKGGGKKPAAKAAAQPAAGSVTDAVKAPIDSLKKGLNSLFGTKK